MLFMGQEWVCSSPFCYFTDHEPVLGGDIAKGPRKEFEQFSAFPDPEKRAKIPDPQAEQTFLRSKPNWNEITEGQPQKGLCPSQDFIRCTQAQLEARRR